MLKNTSKLASKEFEEIKVAAGSADEIESSLIEEHRASITFDAGDASDARGFVEGMMDALRGERQDGEKVHDFEERIGQEMDALLKDVLRG